MGSNLRSRHLQKLKPVSYVRYAHNPAVLSFDSDQSLESFKMQSPSKMTNYGKPRNQVQQVKPKLSVPVHRKNLQSLQSLLGINKLDSVRSLAQHPIMRKSVDGRCVAGSKGLMVKIYDQGMRFKE